MMSKITEISGKVAPATSKSNFGGPAGCSALERASPPMAAEKYRKKIKLSLFCYEGHMLNRHGEGAIVKARGS